MGKLTELIKKAIAMLNEDGIVATARYTKGYIYKKTHPMNQEIMNQEIQRPEMCADVLFINGCDPGFLPHPPRYRITHQREQLLANNIVSDEVYYTDLSIELVSDYRLFVFFRCPYTPLVGDFIKTAKKLHKTVLFDIDDLVIDTKYTDLIPYVQSLNGKEKADYDDGVVRMGRTLSLCDAAITTTERLEKELLNYVPEVYINRNTASEKMYMLSEEAWKAREEKNDNKGQTVDIGYFSGSITHNSDFDLIMPAVTKLLEKYHNVNLHIVGILDLPEELKPFEQQIIQKDFVNWEELPELIASVDINLAPIENTVFNEAKSENKWVEAALVKVPTVASNIGAFKTMITNGETGLLCETTEEWFNNIEMLVLHPEERCRISENAYRYCKSNCVTIYSGFQFAKYIRSKMIPNIAFVLPSEGISGGIMVALKHASVLYDHGTDIMIINTGVPSGNRWIEYGDYRFPVISKKTYQIYMCFDKAVATMWTTVQFLENYSNIKERYYLVQNFETDFYTPGDSNRILANQTYSPHQPIKFITISRWCESWLKEKYEQKSIYVPNGIDSTRFVYRKRDLTGKIRVLVEGDCAVYYKNIDETFRIIDRLDPKIFEVWYMSYNAEPKEYYRVDRFLHKVPYSKTYEVYIQCDILIKSSILESFSYPPLEMMASGGYVVLVQNEGNAEYVRDRENCLIYKRGDIDGALHAINELCEDKQLQNVLYKNGLKTAKERDWDNYEHSILELYK